MTMPGTPLEGQNCGGEAAEKGSNVAPKREPKCTKCANHGLDRKLKGHRNFCRFGLCACSECCLVDQRRVVMKKQVAAKRKKDAIRNYIQTELKGGNEDLSDLVFNPNSMHLLRYLNRKPAHWMSAHAHVPVSSGHSSAYENVPAEEEDCIIIDDSRDMHSPETLLTEVQQQCEDLLTEAISAHDPFASLKIKTEFWSGVGALAEQKLRLCAPANHNQEAHDVDNAQQNHVMNNGHADGLVMRSSSASPLSDISSQPSHFQFSDTCPSATPPQPYSAGTTYRTTPNLYFTGGSRYPVNRFGRGRGAGPGFTTGFRTGGILKSENGYGYASATDQQVDMDGECSGGIHKLQKMLSSPTIFPSRNDSIPNIEQLSLSHTSVSKHPVDHGLDQIVQRWPNPDSAMTAESSSQQHPDLDMPLLDAYPKEEYVRSYEQARATDGDIYRNILKSPKKTWIARSLKRCDSDYMDNRKDIGINESGAADVTLTWRDTRGRSHPNLRKDFEAYSCSCEGQTSGAPTNSSIDMPIWANHSDPTSVMTSHETHTSLGDLSLAITRPAHLLFTGAQLSQNGTLGLATCGGQPLTSLRQNVAFSTPLPNRRVNYCLDKTWSQSSADLNTSRFSLSPHENEDMSDIEVVD